VLAWQSGDLRKPEELAAPVAVHLEENDEVLRPDWFVSEPSQGDGPLKAQLLVQELPPGTPFDALPKGLDGRRSWEATPQQRLERLLKESEQPICLLRNGVALRLVYAPRGETALLDSTASDPAHNSTRQALESIGERYHQFRAELMGRNNEGLTSTYNRFHDPAETSSGHLELRRLHGEMDQAVLHAYGWSDVPTACGFGLDYLDSEEDAQLPDELQERIDSGALFFWEAGEALDFQGQLQAYGAITGRRKLPWRYRWPVPSAMTCSPACWR
jgi:hypothetical protein